MDFIKLYDLLIGIILLILGTMLFFKSKELSDVPEKKGQYSQKIMAIKFSLFLILIRIFIIISRI